MITVRLAGLLAVALLLPVVPSAQSPVTMPDLARLDSTTVEIKQQLAAVRATDVVLVTELERTLVELTDEIAYLRVKLRREGTVSREEYASLQNRLEALRARASGRAPGTSPAGAKAGSGITALPVGAELEVRLVTPLNSGLARPEERFEALTVLDYQPAGAVLIPQGALVLGFIGSVRAAGKIDRRGSLTLSFDELRFNDRSFRLRASVVEALDAKAADEARRLAAAGSVVSAVPSGSKSALAGVIVGSGGTMAARDGADVDLPQGTILRIRVDQPLELAVP